MLLDPKKPSAKPTTISSKTRYKSTQLEANALRAVLGFGDKPVQAAKPKKQPKTNNKKTKYTL